MCRFLWGGCQAVPNYFTGKWHIFDLVSLQKASKNTGQVNTLEPGKVGFWWKSMEAIHITHTSETNVMQPADQRTSNWKGQASPITSTPLHTGRLHLISRESSSEFNQAFSHVLTNSHILHTKASHATIFVKLAQKLNRKGYFLSFHNPWTKLNKRQMRCDSAV